MIKWLTILLILALSVPSAGQQKQADANELDNLIVKLPPLKCFIDSAMIHSPILNQQDCQIAIRQLQLERKRKQWMEYFNIETFIRYGNNASYITNSFDTGIYNNLSTTSSQMLYGVGFTVKYPIFNLFSQHKDNSIAKQEIKSAGLQREVYQQELRKSIIELYNKVLLSHALLKAKLNALQTSSLAVTLSEIDFKQSKITANEYSKVTDANMKNITEYQLVLADLRLALDLLQELSGYNFLKQ